MSYSLPPPCLLSPFSKDFLIPLPGLLPWYSGKTPWFIYQFGQSYPSPSRCWAPAAQPVMREKGGQGVSVPSGWQRLFTQAQAACPFLACRHLVSVCTSSTPATLCSSSASRCARSLMSSSARHVASLLSSRASSGVPSWPQLHPPVPSPRSYQLPTSKCQYQMQRAGCKPWKYGLLSWPVAGIGVLPYLG